MKRTFFPSSASPSKCEPAAAVPALRERRRVEHDRRLLRRLHRQPREQVERGRRRGCLRRGVRVDAEEVCVQLGRARDELEVAGGGLLRLGGLLGGGF